MRAYESNLQSGIFFFDFADQLDVAVESNRGGIQDQKLIVFANLNSLLPVNLVRGSIQQPAPGNHPRRIRQPNRIPIRLNLSRRGPPRTRSAVKILKTWRVQQNSLHYIRHSSPSVSCWSIAYLCQAAGPPGSVAPKSFYSSSLPDLPTS